jgi:crossover junction endodeoxyribonuclease RuvC
MVSPAQWKRAMHLTSDKEQSRARALETFPVCAHHFARKKDHGRAEAALIALYGASHIKGHQDAH